MNFYSLTWSKFVNMHSCPFYIYWVAAKNPVAIDTTELETTPLTKLVFLESFLLFYYNFFWRLLTCSTFSERLRSTWDSSTLWRFAWVGSSYEISRFSDGVDYSWICFVTLNLFVLWLSTMTFKDFYEKLLSEARILRSRLRSRRR